MRNSWEQFDSELDGKLNASIMHLLADSFTGVEAA